LTVQRRQKNINSNSSYLPLQRSISTADFHCECDREQPGACSVQFDENEISPNRVENMAIVIREIVLIAFPHSPLEAVPG
jgi:hypothetical protein